MMKADIVLRKASMNVSDNSEYLSNCNCCKTEDETRYGFYRIAGKKYRS